jgi:hypothetical protein
LGAKNLGIGGDWEIGVRRAVCQPAAFTACENFRRLRDGYGPHAAQAPLRRSFRRAFRY